MVSFQQFAQINRVPAGGLARRLAQGSASKLTRRLTRGLLLSGAIATSLATSPAIAQDALYGDWVTPSAPSAAPPSPQPSPSASNRPSSAQFPTPGRPSPTTEPQSSFPPVPTSSRPNVPPASTAINPATQFRDVSPTDWAYAALQSLNNRYGCLSGYPDGRFRGNQAMTRYEFAAALNACLDGLGDRLGLSLADGQTLQDLQQEFRAELADLDRRVTRVEERLDQGDRNEFSATTKLRGEAVFDLGGALSGEVYGRQVDRELTYGGYVGLDLVTSFTGQDALKTRLLAGNVQSYVDRTGVPEAELAYAGPNGDTDNGVELDELYYRFPLGRAQLFLGVKDLFADDVAPTTANFQADSVADYFVNNPLSYDFPGGAGLGANYQLTHSLNIAAAYLANDVTAGRSGDNQGVSSGGNTLFSQLTFQPDERLTTALTFNRSYEPDFVTVDSFSGFTVSEAATANAIALNAGYALNPKLNISGWVGHAWVNSQDSDAQVNLFDWALNLGLPDLFYKGNYGGISIGAYPYFRNSEGGFFPQQAQAPMLAQVFYRLKVTDNITVQPGIVYLIDPLGDRTNDNIWIGSLRTKFAF